MRTTLTIEPDVAARLDECQAADTGMSFKEKTGKKVVLVGTYRAGQLERWPGYYNYPLNAGDAVDAGAAERVIVRRLKGE